MANSQQRDDMQQFYEAIANLKSQEECQKFFAPLMNSSELRALEQRVDLALFMQQGSAYLDVLEKSGAGSQAVEQIRKVMLEHGIGGMIEELIQREKPKE